MRLLILIVSLFYSVKTQTDTNVKDLLTNLFTTRSYNALVRPTTDQSTPTDIYIEFFLYGINGVDELQQKLSTTGYLEISWTDELLTWDPASYGDLQFLHVPQANVWLPDIALQNGFKNLEGLGSKFINVYVFNDGLVLWQPFHVFESKCSLDTTYFPFERQSCKLEFVAWSLDSDDVSLAVGTEGIVMDEGMDSNAQWSVVSSSATSFSESGESRVQFTIVLKRKPLFYIINIILPIILLSVLNIFTFQIPADIGERMGYTVTVWLSFAVFLTIISSSLPQSSDTVPILSIYIMIQLGIGSVSVLLSAWESRAVGRSEDKPVTTILRKLVSLKGLKCRKRKITDSDEKMDRIKGNNAKIIVDSEKHHQENTKSTAVDWKTAIAALDFFCFWVFSLILLISTTCLLLITGLNN